jgi:hypothetical protein
VDWKDAQPDADSRRLDLRFSPTSINGFLFGAEPAFECLLRLGAAGRPQSAGSAGQRFAQSRPLAADPGPYAADHGNDRNEQEAQEHRVFDQRGAIFVSAQAADESQGI